MLSAVDPDGNPYSNFIAAYEGIAMDSLARLMKADGSN